MVLDCGQLHQAVGTILLVQVEHPEDQRESGEDTETDTEPPVNTYHIEDDEQQENGQQAPDKEVQVLCLQAVEFHVAADSLAILQEEGTKDCRRDDEEDAGSKPAPGGFTCVGVAAAELRIYLNGTYQPHNSPCRIYQLGGGVKITGKHGCSLCYTGTSVPFGIGTQGGNSYSCDKRNRLFKMSFHMQSNFLV